LAFFQQSVTGKKFGQNETREAIEKFKIDDKIDKEKRKKEGALKREYDASQKSSSSVKTIGDSKDNLKLEDQLKRGESLMQGALDSINCVVEKEAE
jgi:hypothetical protein